MRLTSALPPRSSSLARSLNPLRHIGIGRSAMRRVVFKSAILRGIVRRGDDNAVGETPIAAAIVDEDRPGDDGRRRDPVIPLNDGFDVVGGKDFQRVALGGAGQGMRVLSHEQHAIRAMRPPEIADRLGYGKNMRLGERAVARRAAMAARAEADPRCRVVGIRPGLEILPLEPGRVDQHLLRRRLASQG